jgi:hypothetical protein
MIHELKTWIDYFSLVANGEKTFELRKNDRGFLAGHELLLREYDKDKELYTGRKLLRRITFILQGDKAEELGLKKGFCIMGLEEI